MLNFSGFVISGQWYHIHRYTAGISSKWILAILLYSLFHLFGQFVWSSIMICTEWNSTASILLAEFAHRYWWMVWLTAIDHRVFQRWANTTSLQTSILFFVENLVNNDDESKIKTTHRKPTVSQSRSVDLKDESN